MSGLKSELEIGLKSGLGLGFESGIGLGLEIMCRLRVAVGASGGLCTLARVRVRVGVGVRVRGRVRTMLGSGLALPQEACELRGLARMFDAKKNAVQGDDARACDEERV